MIGWHQQICLQVPIKSKDSSRIVNYIKLIGSKYKGWNGSMLQSLPHDDSDHDLILTHINKRLGSDRRGDFALDIFSSDSKNRVIFVLAFGDMKSLTTDWGKAHHKKCSAYPIIHVFTETNKYEKHIKKFCVVASKAAKKHFL